MNVAENLAPTATKGEINSTPAGGWEVSVVVAAPVGRLVAVAEPTDANVTTISPFSRKAAVEVIVGTVVFRNASAAVSAPVSVAHDAPAAPSGQGGWTIVSSSCGGSLASSAVSFANALPSRPDHPLSSVPAAIACVSIYGATVGCALAAANDVAASSISHTCVIAGSFVVLVVAVFLGVVAVGVVVSDAAGVLAAFVASSALAPLCLCL